MRRYIILISIAALVIAIDQFVKSYVHTHFILGESMSVVQGFFNITYVRNFGAAFGFLHETQPAFRENFFLLMPPVALLFILNGVKPSDTRQILALSLVFGGAIGNYIDRLRFRYVIDFLDFHWHEAYTYPAFNVADMSIVGGVAALLLIMFLERKNVS